jgi:hypothetical protein
MPPSSANQTLTINGANFVSGDTLTFVPPEGGTIASTASKLTFVSSSQLTYQFNNGSDSGSWTVTINSPDGTQHSSTASFTVTAAPPGTQYGVDYAVYGNGGTATTGVNVPGIKAAGKQFVGEYIGTAENYGYLRPADVETLTSQGLQIVSLFERTPTSASYFTLANADSDAADAIAASIEAGQPSGSAIYFTVDFDPGSDAASLSAIDNYFQEIRYDFNQYFSVHPGTTYDIGVYAPGDVLPTIMTDASVGASYSWSWGSSYSSANLTQTQDSTTGNPIVIGGVDVDLDEAYTANFGQWGNSLTPVLNISTTSLTLPATTQGIAGTTTSFTVSGSGLGSSDTLTLVAPTGSEISQNGSSGFVHTFPLDPDASGNLSTTTVYARISASATANVSGYLTVQDALHISLNKSIQVNGTVISTPPPPSFGGSSVISGNLQTTLSGLSSGGTVVFQVSSDLKNWTPIQTNVVNTSTLSFTNPINPALKSQFFRTTVQ